MKDMTMKTANITDDVIKPAQDRADCTIIPTSGHLEWTARQNDRYGFKLSDVLVSISYTGCQWFVNGQPINKHPDWDDGTALGRALVIAFRTKRILNACATLGLTMKLAKHGTPGDTFYAVDPKDEDACVEICFYDGYCHIAGSQARVKNVSVSNLVTHLRRKIAHARCLAQQDRFNEECDKARKAAHAEFIADLRNAGLSSNDKRTLKIADSTRHEDGTWTFEVEYHRKDDTLSATIKAKAAATVLSKVSLLDTF